MIDIKQTSEGDIDLSTRDILYGESTEQHQRDILLSGKGHFKESPLTGVDAARCLNDENPDEFLRTARKEFARDGMKVKSLSVRAGELNVQANYPV
ncbi:hypothetical protein EZS27_014998 [termite gut metagenome]|uniref:Uncharacterized protein n=1 Tax=termite gut metagenome TaxID=433724 RepID=A0A5J4RSA5_9ZZZZ